MSKKKDIPVKAKAAAPGEETAVARWSGLGNLRDEIERLLDTFEPRSWSGDAPFNLPGLRAGAALSPAIDVKENDKAFTVAAELPGLAAGEIDVKVGDGTLTISGEKSETEEHEEDDVHVSERRWGSFRRSVRVPSSVDADKIAARFENGVLTVTLPKSDTALAAERKIDVEAA